MTDNFNDRIRRLIERAKNGDGEAFGELWKIYEPEILRRVRKKLGMGLRSKMESMDLVQDVFIDVFRDLKNLKGEDEAAFLRWASKIVENTIRDNDDKFKAKKRDKRRGIPPNSSRRTKQDSIAGVTGPVTWTTPSRKASAKEDLDRLKKAMDKLPPKYKEVIVLAKKEGLSHKEMAERLGGSAHSNRSLLSRALAALTKAYGEI